MSHGGATFDWLIATSPRGFLCGSTAANSADVEATFVRAHERAGHVVTRLTYQEARDRLKVARTPARELYSAPPEAEPISAPPAESADPLPLIGATVDGAWGVCEVIAHLRWPDTHPTHAGRTAAHLRWPGGEGLAYPGETSPHRPAPPLPSPAPLPHPVQPSLF